MFLTLIASVVGWIVVYPPIFARSDLTAQPAYKLLLAMSVNDLFSAFAWSTNGWLGVRQKDVSEELELVGLTLFGYLSILGR